MENITLSKNLNKKEGTLNKMQLIRILPEITTSIYQNVYNNVRRKAENLIKNGKQKP
jgi:hypothetical protein